MKKILIPLGILSILLITGCFQRTKMPAATTTDTSNSNVYTNTVNTTTEPLTDTDQSSDDTNDHLDDALKDLDMVE